MGWASHVLTPPFTTSPHTFFLRPPLNKSRGFRLCCHSHHPAMEARGRSPGLLGRRTPAWRTSALWVSTRPAFVRWYSRARPTPGSGRLDAREERSMPVVQHGRVFTPSPPPGTRTRFSWKGTASLFFLSGEARASLLVPSSAFLLTRRGQAQHTPPSAETPLSRRLPCLSSRLHSLVGWRASASACASLA